MAAAVTTANFFVGIAPRPGVSGVIGECLVPFAESIIIDLPPAESFRPAPPVRLAYARPVDRANAIVRPSASTLARNSDVPVVASADENLTAIERAIIALSLRDPIASVKPQGWFSRSGFSVLVFGPRRTFLLANPRLEALRRYAILFRHADPEAAAAGQSLREAGYSAGQIDEIDRRSAASRHKRRAWAARFRPAVS
jgi:hypothetical protein